MPKVYEKTVSTRQPVLRGQEADFVGYDFCRRGLCLFVIFLGRHVSTSTAKRKMFLRSGWERGTMAGRVQVEYVSVKALRNITRNSSVLPMIRMKTISILYLVGSAV